MVCIVVGVTYEKNNDMVDDSIASGLFFVLLFYENCLILSEKTPLP
jgi:hypothetical protein